LLSEFALVVGLSLKPLRLGAKFNSAPNPSGLRSNPSNIANPDRKYPEIPRKTSIWGTSGTFCPMTPSENSTIRCRIKFCRYLEWR
jgi:hypothetical protein